MCDVAKANAANTRLSQCIWMCEKLLPCVSVVTVFLLLVTILFFFFSYFLKDAFHLWKLIGSLQSSFSPLCDGVI